VQKDIQSLLNTLSSTIRNNQQKVLTYVATTDPQLRQAINLFDQDKVILPTVEAIQKKTIDLKKDLTDMSVLDTYNKLIVCSNELRDILRSVRSELSILQSKRDVYHQEAADLESKRNHFLLLGILGLPGLAGIAIAFSILNGKIADLNNEEKSLTSQYQYIDKPSRRLGYTVTLFE
jgi:hypothetical protein